MALFPTNEEVRVFNEQVIALMELSVTTVMAEDSIKQKDFVRRRG